jgi:hypothetical protein
MIEEGDEHLTAVQQVLCTGLLIPPLTGSTHLHGDVLWRHHDACQANGQGNHQYTAAIPIRPIGLNTSLSLSGLSVSPRNKNSTAPLTVQVP